jgi:hypothetical protein
MLADAIEAFSLVLAARGTSPPIYTTVVRCLSSLEGPSPALLFLMQACACVALLSTTHTQRKPHLAAELEGILQEYEAKVGRERFSPTDEDPDAALIRACHEVGQISLLALVVLVRAALGKRIGGATALAQRVDAVISKCKDTSADGGPAHQDADEQNEVKIFRSVRSL